MNKLARLCLLAWIFGIIPHSCIAADDDQRPPEYLCPTTQAVMGDPVVTTDDHSDMPATTHRAPNLRCNSSVGCDEMGGSTAVDASSAAPIGSTDALTHHLSNQKQAVEEEVAVVSAALAAEEVVAAPLTFTPSTSISTGVYESDNIEAILSLPLREFGKQDVVIFDVDEVLITGLDPYYFEHYQKKTSLHEKLFSQGKTTIDKFFLYMFLSKSWSPMDENLPGIVKILQSQEIKCIANTALNPTIHPELGVDVPTLRVRTLRSFGIDFSGAFPQLLSWNFDTLDAKHVPKNTPLFKEGVIFSSETPKHISTLEFFRRADIKPRKVLFVDDFLENSQKMHKALSSLGIECYSFFYSKKNSKSLRSYFSEEMFARELKKIEAFIERLLNTEDVDDFFR